MLQCKMRGGRQRHMPSTATQPKRPNSTYFARSSILLNILVALDQRCLSFSPLLAMSSSAAPSSRFLSVRNLLSAHLKMPPAAYWTIEYLVSPCLMEAFEWTRRDDGSRTVLPGGNLIVRPKSHKTRSPP